MKTYPSVDEHIASFPPDTQLMLNQLRQTIQKLAPEATEKISYGIPTYHLNGNLVHFAGYKTHIGFYPGSAAIKEFASELSGYETSKGTIRFPLNKPLPLGLINKIVIYRIRANQGKKLNL